MVSDAIRAMASQGWDRQRLGAAMQALLKSENLRSSPVHGFGGNAHAYGLTTKPFAG